MSEPSRFELQHLKDKPEDKALLRGKMVRIYSGEHECWWRPEAKGYTRDSLESGIWAFEEAWQDTCHCGPEKRIYFEVIAIKKGQFEPAGYRCSRFVDGKIKECVFVTSGEFAGWFCYRHPDGQFVSLRQATPEECAEFGYNSSAAKADATSERDREIERLRSLLLDNEAFRLLRESEAELTAAQQQIEQLTKRAEAAEADCAAMRGILTRIDAAYEKMSGMQRPPIAAEVDHVLHSTHSGQHLLDRLKKAESDLAQFTAIDFERGNDRTSK